MFEDIPAYLQTETLTLDVGQGNRVIVVSRLLHQVTLLTLILLYVLLRSRTHHCHFHLSKNKHSDFIHLHVLVTCWLTL